MAGRATAKALATDGFFATIEFAEITKFSLDALMKLAGQAGLMVRVEIMRPAA
jgi:hypothetical protein